MKSEGKVPPLPYLNLVTEFGKKQIKKAEKRYGVKLGSKDGASFIVEEDGRYYFVMYVRGKNEYENAMAIIAHESYHLACRYFECLWDKPSEETMAYTIDSISYEAMRRYRKWVDSHAKD